MKMNLVRRSIVDASLGLSQAAEHRHRPCPHALLERAGADQRLDLPQIAVIGLLGIDHHPHLSAGDSSAAGAVGLDAVTVQPQLGQFQYQFVVIQPQIEQRRQMHVAADTGKAIVIKDVHRSNRWSMGEIARKNKAASGKVFILSKPPSEKRPMAANKTVRTEIHGLAGIQAVWPMAGAPAAVPDGRPRRSPGAAGRDRHSRKRRSPRTAPAAPRG